MPVLKYKVNGEWVEVGGGGSAGSIDIDLEGANAGNPNPVNADTLDGRPASDYATKIYVSEKIAEAQIGSSTGNIDLSSYVTKDDLKDFITEIPSEYVTESELNAKGYLTEHQSLEGYATEEFVEDKLDEAKPLIVTEENASYQDIIDAKNAGRVIQAIDDNGLIYNLTAVLDEGIMFIVTDGVNVLGLILTSDNQWQRIETSLPNAEDFYTKLDTEILIQEAVANLLTSANAYTDDNINTLAERFQIELKEILDVTETFISAHNISTDSHNDIRLLIEGLTTRLNTLANSDDITLDQMSEIAAYIKNNKTLIEGITTNKVNVSDIINNLTTNVSNKPLSAAQGVALKTLIDNIVVPTKVSELTNDKGYLVSVPAEYVTESELNAKGYLTEHQSLDGLATIDYVNNKFAEDKASIVNDVLAALPTWTGGSY